MNWNDHSGRGSRAPVKMGDRTRLRRENRNMLSLPAGRVLHRIPLFMSIVGLWLAFLSISGQSFAADTIFNPASGDYCRPNVDSIVDTGGLLVISDFTFTKTLTLCPSADDRLGATLTTSENKAVFIWFRFRGDEDFVNDLKGRYRAAKFTGCVLADYEFVTECENKSHRLKFRHDTLEAGIAQEVTSDEQVTFDWRFKAALNGRPAGIYRVMLFYHGIDICSFPNQPAPCPIVFEVK